MGLSFSGQRATTDPAAIIAVFRDLGAPRRLTWLVEGEALLNDAAAIALFILLLGFVEAGRQPSVIAGLGEFILLFGGSFFGPKIASACWLGNRLIAKN